MNQTEDLYISMIRLTVRAKRHLSILCESKQLTPVQGIVLIILEPSHTLTMHELSEAMGCDASNITGLVDRLEVHKLIERTACETDRRIKRIKLTKKGEQCRRDIVQIMKQAEVLDLDRLSGQEKTELLRLISKVLD